VGHSKRLVLTIGHFLTLWLRGFGRISSFCLRPSFSAGCLMFSNRISFLVMLFALMWLSGPLKKYKKNIAFPSLYRTAGMMFLGLKAYFIFCQKKRPPPCVHTTQLSILSKHRIVDQGLSFFVQTKRLYESLFACHGEVKCSLAGVN